MINISLEHQLKDRNWKMQTIGDLGISQLIGRIENGEYKSEKIKVQVSTVGLKAYDFSCPDLYEFIKHVRLVNRCNLDYPIILDHRGAILDGRHRLVKAILEGEEYIDGIMVLDDLDHLVYPDN